MFWRVPSSKFLLQASLHRILKLLTLVSYNNTSPVFYKEYCEACFGIALSLLCAVHRLYFPMQNFEKISFIRSSPTSSPIISPRLAYASIKSMVYISSGIDMLMDSVTASTDSLAYFKSDKCRTDDIISWSL